MPRHAVYLQLLYRGWHVHVGKLYDKEVDFVAVKDGRTVYVQVTDEMFSDTTRQRELRSLQSIRDSYEKVIVVRQGRYVYCQALADKIGVMISTLSAFCVPTAFPTSEICQA